MAFGTITSTSNTFGSVDGTATGVVPGTLSGSIGVPGPAGPTGPQGPAGAAGVGVPAGGTAGQFLTKIDGTNYNTDWTTINLSAYVLKANNLSDLTSASTARVNLSLGPTNTVAFRTVNLSEGAVAAGDTLSTLSIATSAEGYALTASTVSFVEGDTSPIVSESGTINLNKSGFYLYRYPTYNTSNPSNPTSGGEMNYVASTGVLTIRAFDDGAATDDTITVEPTGVTFADSTKQVTAFLPADYYTASYIDTTFAPLDSPIFTGNPTAPTAALGDNDTSIATTAFVQQELLSGTANARNLEVQVRNQSGSTMAAGSIVYISGATGNLPLITKAQANNDANSAQTIGFVKTSIANNGTGYVIVRGELENIDTSALSEGVQLYLSPSTAGTWTTTKPSAPEHLVYVGVVIRSHPTLGVILVSVQNGFEVAELHDSAISSPANNDLFVYELSTDLWKNKSFATLGLATLASPTFTGTPSLPTGTTAVTQSAGNNTTALATTAFVQQEVPAASTTAAGKVELATNAETITSNSATLVPALDDLPAIITRPENRSINYINSTAVSGSGAVASNNFGLREMFLNSLATGRAAFWLGLPGFNQTSCLMSRANNQLIDFSKKIWMSGKACAGFQIATNYMGDSNTTIRVTLGGYNTNTTGDMTGKGFGWKKAGGTSPFFTLTVHNGTTLTDVATSVQQSDKKVIDWVIYSDGTGNVTLYIDGVQAATTSAGPTGNSTAGWSMYREQVEATATPTVRAILHSTGGHIYTEG